jgi:hypothetical protein
MSTHDEDDGDYEVGYGRPPKGRPKGAKGFKTSVKRELEPQITVTEGKRQMTISKLEAAAKRFVAKGLGGDVKVLVKLLELDVLLFGDSSDDDMRERADKIEAVDLDILRHYFANEPAATLAEDTMEEEAGHDLH